MRLLAGLLKTFFFRHFFFLSIVTKLVFVVQQRIALLWTCCALICMYRRTCFYQCLSSTVAWNLLHAQSVHTGRKLFKLIWCLEILKSIVAIASRLCQIKQPNIFFIRSKNNYKISGKLDCWICQMLQFKSKRQNSMVLKLKKWFQRWDTIQNSI